MLRTAYLAATDRDLAAQLEHAMRDRSTALVYGPEVRRGRVAAAILAVEKRTGKSLRVQREHDRWVIAR